MNDPGRRARAHGWRFVITGLVLLGVTLIPAVPSAADLPLRCTAFALVILGTDNLGWSRGWAAHAKRDTG